MIEDDGGRINGGGEEREKEDGDGYGGESDASPSHSELTRAIHWRVCECFVVNVDRFVSVDSVTECLVKHEKRERERD